MPLAASYPLLEVVWTMVIFFLLLAWLCLVVFVLGDIIRRQDTTGWAKVLWILLVLVLPYLGVFIYLIAEQSGMAERARARHGSASSLSGGHGQAASEAQIERARGLLAEGSINQAEFDLLTRSGLSAT